jgi:hypothetical protein
MASQERCPKNPSMPKAYCSHCQGIKRGTVDNPLFSLREHYSNGFPIVEVLKNGGPVHWYDREFQFGVRKAQMLLACVNVLWEFWQSSEADRRDFRSPPIVDQRHGLHVLIFVKMHPDFERSGERIERPWLHLQAWPGEGLSIGLGAMKCRAIYAVKEDLRDWLRGQGIPD